MGAAQTRGVKCRYRRERGGKGGRNGARKGGTAEGKEGRKEGGTEEGVKLRER